MISQDRPGHEGLPPAATGPQNVNAGDASRPGASEQDVAAEIPFDYIDEALEETIPASDPPSFTPGTGIGPPHRREDKKPRDPR